MEVFYGDHPTYIICSRTNGTQSLQTDYATQKHLLNVCLLKRKNFTIHSYHTAWIIMISTAVVNYALYIQTAVTDIGH